MDSNSSFLILLLIGVLVVLFDGWLVYHSSAQYLQRAYEDSTTAGAAGRMLTALFYLVMLGILAVVVTVDTPTVWSLATVISRLGVMLLVLAAGHALAIWLLAAMRSRQQESRLNEKLANQYEDRNQANNLTVQAIDPDAEAGPHSSDQAYLAPGLDFDSLPNNRS